MNMITLLPNLMPLDIEEWPTLLNHLVERGYNTFHFAPLQKQGLSRSAYSIYNHNKFAVSNPKRLKEIFRDFQKRGCSVFVDVVLNHISEDSEVLTDPKNSDFFYNVKNTPSLAPILELDLQLLHIAPQIVAKFFAGNNNAMIENEGQIDQILKFIEEKILKLKLYEYYLVNLKNVETEYPIPEDFDGNDYEITWDDFGTEYSNHNDIILANIKSILSFQKLNLEKVAHGRYSARPKPNFMDSFSKGKTLKVLRAYNELMKLEFEETIVQKIIKNLRNHLFYGIYKDNKPISEKNLDQEIQVFPKYFKKVYNSNSPKSYTYALLNGWLFEGHKLNILKDHGISFLEREIVIWDDVIKLNYENLENKPRLQTYMRNYMETLESISDGFRIDNLHNSHPSIVAFMLNTLAKLAYNRSDKKQIMMLGELFCGNHQKEIVFCNKLGLHYLTRELIHYNGKDTPLPYQPDDKQSQIHFIQTHDNETYTTHNKLDLVLPHTSHCIATPNFVLTGSTLLGDELWPHKVETRDWAMQYDMSILKMKEFYHITEALDDGSGNKGWVSQNEIEWLYDRTIWYKKQGEEKNVLVKGSWNGWSHPSTLQEHAFYYFVGRVRATPGDNSFKFIVDDEWKNATNYLNGQGINALDEHHNHVLKVPHLSLLKKLFFWHPSQGVLVARKLINNFKTEAQKKDLVKGTEDSTTLTLDWWTHLYQTAVHKNKLTGSEKLGSDQELELYQIVVKNGNSGQKHSIPIFSNLVHFQVITMIHSDPRPYYLADTELARYGFIDQGKLHLINLPDVCTVLIKSQEVIKKFENIDQMVNNYIKSNPAFKKKLSLRQLNFLLYSCTEEEKNRNGGDAYLVPGYKKFIYGGLSSLNRALKDPMGNEKVKLHVFDGPWLIDYCFDRLASSFGQNNQLNCLRNFIGSKVPLPIRSEFFKRAVNVIHDKLIAGFLQPIGLSFEHQNCKILNQLLSSVPQFFSEGGLSAGLTHYCTAEWKEWGRDAFVSLPGLLLTTKRFQEARILLLGYAALIKDGMIPSIKKQRVYNSRDAIWWFFYSLGRYLDCSKDYAILDESIRSEVNGSTNSLIFLLEDCLMTHIEGRTGHEIRTDQKTGFGVLYGNPNNILTWMDRRGAGELNKGVAYTPRVGAPIELTALRWYAMKLMSRLSERNTDFKESAHKAAIFKLIVSKKIKIFQKF